MDQQLQTLIELQERDSRIAGMEAEAARLPRQLEAIQASLAEALDREAERLGKLVRMHEEEQQKKLAEA